MHVSDVEAEAYDELLQEASSACAMPRHRSQSVALESPRQVPFAKRPSSLTVKRSQSSRTILNSSTEEPGAVQKVSSRDANGRMSHRHSAPEIKEAKESKHESKSDTKGDIAQIKDCKQWEL